MLSIPGIFQQKFSFFAEIIIKIWEFLTKNSILPKTTFFIDIDILEKNFAKKVNLFWHFQKIVKKTDLLEKYYFYWNWIKQKKKRNRDVISIFWLKPFSWELFLRMWQCMWPSFRPWAFWARPVWLSLKPHLWNWSCP